MIENEKIKSLKLGIQYIKFGEIKKAEEIFLSLLEDNPNDNNALHLLGYINITKGEIDEGIILIKKSLSLIPNFPEALINLGNAYIQKKQYNEAIKAFQKAISIKEVPGFWTALGNAHFAKGDSLNAKISYEKSISLNSNDPIAYNNIGIILKKQGNRDEAKNYFLQSLKFDKNSVDANINLNSVMKEMVPNWHIAMMNDTGRNDALFRAIKDVVQKGDFVFEVGSGSGLLSMMSISQGAGKVVSCETSSEIASTAAKILNKNGYEKQITIINKHSRDIAIGKDLPGKADIIISEILSSEFVGENILSSLYDVKRRLLKVDGKMIPESGGIMIALVGESDFIKENLYVDNVYGFDLSDFNSIINRKHGIKNRHDDINIISDPVEVFHFDFYSEELSIKKLIDLEIEANQSNKCYGVITWNKINLSENITYENDPSKIDSHWTTPLYLFKNPIKVEKGKKIIISCSIEKDRTWYDLK